MDLEDGFHRWKWQSELNGERLPSIGMELVPFSEKKARDLSEASEQTGCKGTAFGWAFKSCVPLSWAPLRNTNGRFSCFSLLCLQSCYQGCRECVFIPGSQQCLLHLIQKRKYGLSSLWFPNCSFSETSLRLKLGAHFHLGMKSSGRCHQQWQALKSPQAFPGRGVFLSKDVPYRATLAGSSQ